MSDEVHVSYCWNGVGPSELTTEGAQDGLRAAVEAALDAWEQYRGEHS